MLSFNSNLNKKEQAEKNEILKDKIEQVDLTKIKSIGDLVTAFRGMSIQARNIGDCAQVFEKMLTDPERPTIMLGLAGPLIAAGLRKVIRDMIEFNMVDVIVSTGAILYQDFYQARGYGHFKGSPNADDTVLRHYFIDRIYDTYVDEQKFVDLDNWIGETAAELTGKTVSSREFLHFLSSYAKDENSILATARKHGIPIFCPALNDSSIGIGLTHHYHMMRQKGKTPMTISSIQDNYELTQIVHKSRRTSAFYVAGGVPKNYINDSVVMTYIFDRDTGGHKYALQVTTDVPHWGGLSGSTLAEAQSWGKVNVEANKAMGFVEPSVSVPLIVGYAMEKKLSQNRSRMKYEWDGDILKSLKF
ncbi:MAG: deoxyhypusine synthase family protein [Deltaproteobacteria bacterium]|nr:deoxyhypusine synthase family protein [Deltaproteobacteria bacterium]